MEKMKMITISREFGSGGRTIGHQVAEALGIPFYDKEILTRAAEESGLCKEVFEHHDEKASVGSMLTGTHMGTVGMGVRSSLDAFISSRNSSSAAMGQSALTCVL